MAREYAAFISYRHCPLDMAVAEAVHKQIERYRIPKDLRKNGEKHLGVVFRDRDELPLSNNLTEDIYEALDHSRFLIVICTPETPESLWVDREIQYFIKKHGRERVLTVLAAGSPEESIPKRITHIWADDGVTVVGQIEPLCAFLVDETQKKVLRNLRSEFLRLVAAMLGCPYDALKQRQKRYRARKMTAICAAAAAVVMTVMGLLIQWNLEVTQKNEEISRINLQLEEQYRQTQLNESQALTLLSQSQLEQGDRMAALENAIAALPEQDERPYYAPAKTALEKALGLYRIGYHPDLRIELPFGLSNLVLSEDGRYGVGITNYKIVTCYDLYSGEILWELPKQDDFSVKSFQFLPQQEGILYTSAGGGQFVLDQFTGQVRFSYDFGNRTFPLDITADHRQMALSNDGCVAFCSLEAEQILWSEPVENNTEPHSCVGAYSVDGSRFLLVCAAEFDGQEQMRARLFDTTDGTLLQDEVLMHPQAEVWQIHVLARENGSFFLSFAYGGYKICGRISADGVLEEQGIFSYEDDYRNGTAFLHQQDKVQQAYGLVFMASPDRINIVDGETCQLVATRTFPEDEEFCKMFQDGSYLAVKDGLEFILYAPTEEGRFSRVRNWKSTIYMETLVFIDNSADVFAAYGDSLQTIRYAGSPDDPMSTVKELPHSLSGNLIYLPNFCGVYPSPSGANLLIMDTDATAHNTGGTYVYHISTDTVMEVPASIGHDGIFTSDEHGVLSGSAFYNLLTGETEELAEDLVTVRGHDQSAGVPVLSAAAQENTLRWWKDGIAAGTAQLPLETAQVAAAGQNDYVIIRSGEETPVYWSYDLKKDQWQQIAYGAREFCMAKSAPLTAFVAEETLCVYDLEANQMRLQLEQLGYGCFAMSFLQQDRVLLIANQEGYTLVDLEAGMILKQISTDATYQNLGAQHLLIREDVSGSHIYLNNTVAETPGLVIETENWTLEWEIPEMLGYLPETDEILCTDGLYQQLYLHPRLPAEELILLGRKLLTGDR